jgi:hypothetical protein
LQGTYIGNFGTTDVGGPTDAFLRNGKVLISVGKKRAFTGTIILDGSKKGFKGGFDENGNWQIETSMSGHAVRLHMILESGELGKRITGSIRIDGGATMSLICLPVAYSGGKGDVFELAGKRINMACTNTGVSGFTFGHGYASANCTREGVVRFAGRLGDGVTWSGVGRVVRDESGGLLLPMAVPLSAVDALLHGELVVEPSPEVGEPNFSSTSASIWARRPSQRTKMYPAGFLEDLYFAGSVWKWSKGTSVLGGSSANFTLSLSQPMGISLPVGLSTRTGTLAASNNPVWNSVAPKGFSMKIKPSTGAVSGKVPATQGGKSVLLPYQGVLFSDNLDIGSNSPVRGAGFITGNGSSGLMEITVP